MEVRRLFYNITKKGEEYYIVATVNTDSVAICITTPEDTNFENPLSAGSYHFTEGTNILEFIFLKIDSLLA